MAKIAVELSNGKIFYLRARNCKVAEEHTAKRIAELGSNLTIIGSRVVTGRERF